MKPIEELAKDYEEAYWRESDQINEYFSDKNFETNGDWSDRSEDKKWNLINQNAFYLEWL